MSDKKIVRPVRSKKTIWQYEDGNVGLLKFQLQDTIAGFSLKGQLPEEVLEIVLVSCKPSPGGPEITIKAGYPKGNSHLHALIVR